MKVNISARNASMGTGGINVPGLGPHQSGTTLRKSTLINRYNSVAHQANRSLSQWLDYRQAKFLVSSESSLPLYCACFG